MKYQPDEDFRKHLNEQGLKGKGFTLDSIEHLDLVDKFRQWHPTETPEQLHQRAAYALLWKDRKKHNAKWYLKWILIAIGALLLLMIGALRAEAQVDCVKWQTSGGATVGNFCAPFSIKGSSQVTFSKSGNVITISSSGANPFTSGGTTAGVLPKSTGASALADSALADNTVRLQAYNQNITNPSDLNTFIAKDDFSTNTGSGWGQLNWTANTIGAAPTVAAVAPDGTEIGIVSITTTAVAGQGGSLSLPSLTAINAIVFDSQFRFKLSSITNISVNVGYATSSATTLNPATSCYMRFDTAAGDTNHFMAQCGATFTDTLVAADTNWHTLRIRAVASGTVTMSIDGSTEATFGSPPSQAQFPWFLVESQTGSTKALSVGAWSIAAYNQARSL